MSPPDTPKLKYEFTEDEISFLLDAVNCKHFSGIKPAHDLLHIVGLLKAPLNLKDLRRDRRKTDQKQG